LQLGGPDDLSPLQVLQLFAELGGPPVTVEHVPEAALEAQLASASNDLEEAYAGAMLGTARGQVVDPRPATALLPGRLISVREYAISLLSKPH
jgi:hypothetical protein